MKVTEQPDGVYDLFIMDAFSSSSIPTHLLTKEAFESYLPKLSANGILAIHISNRNIDLLPVMNQLSRELGLTGRYKKDIVLHFGLDDAMQLAGSWIVLARNEEGLRFLNSYEEAIEWKDLTSPAVESQSSVVCRWAPWVMTCHPIRAWTDDYSNIARSLRWLK